VAPDEFDEVPAAQGWHVVLLATVEKVPAKGRNYSQRMGGGGRVDGRSCLLGGGEGSLGAYDQEGEEKSWGRLSEAA